MIISGVSADGTIAEKKPAAIMIRCIGKILL
jgi:hypothetical protein